MRDNSGIVGWLRPRHSVSGGLRLEAVLRRYAFGHGERADGDCHAAGGHRGIHPAKPRGRREVLPCGGYSRTTFLNGVL